MSAAEAALRKLIREAGGSVSFEAFMRFALYDREHGYYSRLVRTVGRKGDFSTAATLHPALARGIAAWALASRREVAAADGRWHLIELGGGSAEMAAGVLDAFGWWTQRKVRYHIVEVSEGLQKVQQERLAAYRAKVSWHADLAGALDTANGIALIFSNEFVDAFPCARWVYQDGWRELRVAWKDDAAGLVEIVGGQVSTAGLAPASIANARAEEDGQRVEVFTAYHQWQIEQFARWTRGRLLTIDYGDELPALYHRRPAGTLRGFCRQMRITGAEIYARVGRQDLTADVNFTDLQLWGEALGLVTAGLDTQAGFLHRWLPEGMLRRQMGDPRLSAFLDSEGAGGAFKVLEQVRG